jgi:ADP-ribose 1''-phosphate phosphatase
MPIIYKKGDLFQDPNLKDYTIVHACNARGVWGSGFAKQCKEKYPELYKSYKEGCEDFSHHEEPFVGCAFIPDINNNDIIPMICLITSNNYGNQVSPPYLILAHTRLALERMEKYDYFKGKFISPKFNSGLFNVSWEDTEKLLKEFVDRNNVEWVVYDNN